MQSSRWLVIDNAEAYHAHNEGLASSALFGSDASQFSTGATLTQVDLGGVASKGAYQILGADRLASPYTGRFGGGGLQRCRDKGPWSGREGALCLSSSV